MLGHVMCQNILNLLCFYRPASVPPTERPTGSWCRADPVYHRRWGGGTGSSSGCGAVSLVSHTPRGCRISPTTKASKHILVPPAKTACTPPDQGATKRKASVHPPCARLGQGGQTPSHSPRQSCCRHPQRRMPPPPLHLMMY